MCVDVAPKHNTFTMLKYSIIRSGELDLSIDIDTYLFIYLHGCVLSYKLIYLPTYYRTYFCITIGYSYSCNI